MGSSLTSTHYFLLAALCGALFLVFDAARFFLSQIGPVRLRSLSAPEEKPNWFHYSPQSFSLVTGALLQVTLISAVGFTVAALAHGGSLVSGVVAIVIWCVVAIAWKFILALIPDDAAIFALRSLLPLSHLFYFLFWPVLFPLKYLMQRINERKEDEVGEEEVTEEEVQAYIDVGEEVGILEEGEGKLIQSIVDFGDKIAKELMTPRVDVLAFDVKQPISELAKLFSESKYSRIPIYEDTIDRVVGIVHIKDLFDAVLNRTNATVRDIARPALFVPETKGVADLLRDFQIEHLQIAVVVDEYGGTAGLITIEDVIEEIVGEIADEHEDDTAASIVELERDMWLVSGTSRVDDLSDLVEIDLSGDDYETVAGLIFTHLGRVPKVGESLEKYGLLFEIDRADRKRIYRVKISRLAKAGESREEDV